MINYLNTVLNDMSIMVDIIEKDEKIQLWLKHKCQKLNGDVLTVTDSIDNKKYYLKNDTILERYITYSCGLWNDLHESYDDFLKNNLKNINDNNQWFDNRCKIILPYLKTIDNTFENLQICKTLNVIDEINLLKIFGIGNLSGWINNDLSLIPQICNSYYDVLNKHAQNAIDKLEIEKQHFMKTDDTEGVEEIDIIITMIQDSINPKQYDAVLSGQILYSSISNLMDDMRKNWPPILLPVPF